MINFDTIIAEETPQAKRIAEYFNGLNEVILDVGCGPGIYVEALRERGISAIGIDNDDRLPKANYFFKVDLTEDPSVVRTADIILTLEVGEHIPEEYADNYCRYLQRTGAGLIYFSAARPGQGGEGHVNCKPKDYWIKKMHNLGFYLSIDETERWLAFMRQGPHMGWLTQNGMVFRRYE